MKEEALKLADELDNFLKEEEQLPWGTKQVYLDMASTMIRRLVGELNKYKMAWNMAENELEKWKKDLHLQSHVLGFMEGKASQAEEQMMLQKPLSDDEIMNTFENCLFDGGFNAIEFARAIEERHGIKNVQKT